METGEISEKTQRGRHTTRHAELFDLDDEGTGSSIRRDSHPSIFRRSDAEELQHLFPEIGRLWEVQIRQLQAPGGAGCAVKAALEEGRSKGARYDSYWQSYRKLEEQESTDRGMMKQLAPSILSADFSKLAEDVRKIEQGGAHLIHVDVMDGHFVPNISFGAAVMKSLNGRTDLPFDVHLMIEDPDKYLEDFMTPQTEYITVHQEACIHLHRTIQHIKVAWVQGRACPSIRPHPVMLE